MNQYFKTARGVLPLLMLLSACCVLQARAELLSFRTGYNSSGIRSALLNIQTNGTTTVQLVTQGGETNTFRFQLSPDEIHCVETLAYSVDFFGQPDDDTDFATCVSGGTLDIHLHDKNRSLTYRYRPAIDPLTRFLHRIIHQAVLTHSISNGQMIYDAGSAVMESRAGIKVLQPRSLIAPLRERINQAMQPLSDKPTDLPGRQALWKRMMTDGQEIEYALQALAAIMTDEEWMGFLWGQMNSASPRRRALFLGKLCNWNCYGSIPESHMKAFCIAFAAYLQEHPDQFIDPPEEEQPSTYGGSPFSILDEFDPKRSEKVRGILKKLAGD